MSINICVATHLYLATAQSCNDMVIRLINKQEVTIYNIGYFSNCKNLYYFFAVCADLREISK